MKNQSLFGAFVPVSAIIFALGIASSPAQLTGWGLDSGASAANATLTEGSAGSFSVSTPTGNAAPRADFPTITLTVGSAIMLSGSVTINNLFGNEQFRFGLYNNNGNSLGTLSSGLWSGDTASGWLGYMAEIQNASGSGSTIVVGRNGSGTGTWLSGTSSYTVTQSTGPTLTGTDTSAPGTFAFNLTLTLLAANDLGFSYSFQETDSHGTLSVTGSGTDTTGLSSGTTSFDAAGFLLNANTGGAAFTGVTVQAIPEPGTFALLGLGVLALAARRRV